MPDTVVVALIMILAGLIQGLTGFGSALVSMPVLVQTLGLAVAAPMFAVAVLFSEIAMMARYRHSFSVGRVWRLVAASVLLIPVGAAIGPRLPEAAILAILGVVVAGYGAYSLTRPHMPRIANPRWSYLFGGASGLLSGAFNTGGPPYVVYGATQGWTPSEFKANIQGAFIVNTPIVIASHALNGRYTPQVFEVAAVATVAMLGGLLAGMWLDRFISPQGFRRAVQIALIVLGLSLIF
ncbi:MAG: sulfite exporter TauE/SafE family protein [Chloroflexota bacterium]|nr:MAG: Sulfite exporter TauE/SafE [Chloroflexi bacterium OLB13]MEB2366175.1 sulfite exporter TauE/SafE family protein [Chloroflexota bacterium]